MNDLHGQRFGRLVVIERANNACPQGGQHVRWRCLCDCGKFHEAKSSHLRSGDVASCGCLARDTARKEIPAGTVFERWTVLETRPISRKGEPGSELFYLCLCQCGAEKVVRGTKLRSGKSKSCGCYSAELVGKRSLVHGLSQTKEYMATACAKRRALKRQAEGTYTQMDILALYSLQKGLCFYCGASLLAGFHRDHKIPLSRGGNNLIENIALACPSCNVRKHTKTVEEFLHVLTGGT